MRVETTVDPTTGQPHKHYIADPGEVVVMTGPVTGVMTLEDGTAINVNEPFVAVATQEQANELSDKIGQHFADHGHPDDVDVLHVDPEDPHNTETVVVQRPYVYETTAGDLVIGTVGTPHGEHELDAVNGINAVDGDPRIAEATAAAADTKED